MTVETLNELRKTWLWFAFTSPTIAIQSNTLTPYAALSGAQRLGALLALGQSAMGWGDSY